jgi:hypothetical protein
VGYVLHLNVEMEFVNFKESWAPKKGELTMDLGFPTCPEDCGTIVAPGNGKCEEKEVCRSANVHSVSADCCPLVFRSVFQLERESGNLIMEIVGMGIVTDMKLVLRAQKTAVDVLIVETRYVTVSKHVNRVFKIAVKLKSLPRRPLFQRAHLPQLQHPPLGNHQFDQLQHKYHQESTVPFQLPRQ